MKRGPQPGRKQRAMLAHLPPDLIDTLPAPLPPAHLSPDVRAVWDRTAPQFIALRTLHAGTVQQFETRCELVCEIDAWTRTLAVDGVTIGSGAAMRSHPLINSRKNARAQVMRLDLRYLAPKAKPLKP